jgi:hypothetical protein
VAQTAEEGSTDVTGKPGNGEEPRRRTKRRKINNNSNAPEPCKNNIRNYGQLYTGGSDRASLYKKAQDLYRKNRAGLAEVILGGKPLAETVKARIPSLRNVEDLYAGILESPSPADDALFEAKIVERSESLQPITEDEVCDVKTGWSHSAAGSDRVSVAAVKASDDSTLAIFFNVLLLRGVYGETQELFSFLKGATQPMRRTGAQLPSALQSSAFYIGFCSNA